MNRKLIIFLLVVLGNAWIWRILGGFLFLGLGLMSLSFFLVFNFKIPTFILLAVLGSFLLKNTFDTNLLYVSPLEKDKLVHRHEYYSQGLGKIYKNRIGIYLNYSVAPYISRFSKNLSYNLDPNLYFFANHPRERGGVIEFDKFFYISLPIFVFGLTSLLSSAFVLPVIYFAVSLFITAFLFPGYDLGPVLLFPFIVTVLYLGVVKIIGRWI